MSPKQLLNARLVRRCLAVAGILAMTGCAVPVLRPCDDLADVVAWVADYGWHTEIILPAAALTGQLAGFRAPGMTALSFGFGKRDFITVPSPGLGDFVAGAIPGSASVRLQTLHVAPGRSTSSPVVRVVLSPAGLMSLQGFLSAAIVRAPDGTPVVAAPPPDADTRFYSATSGYSLAYTCNSWAADGLRGAGLPMDFGIVSAGGVMAGLARIGGSCAVN